MNTLLFVLIVMISSPPAFAEYKSGFVDTSINYLDWNRSTEDKSTKEDFAYLELEGGSTYNWGDLYGFFDYENPGKPGNDVRTAGKGVLNYFLWQDKFALYLHLYNFAAAGFSEQNRVVGFSYAFNGKGWWVRPFLGIHDVSQTFYTGTNGFMGGWTFGYGFSGWGQNFLLADWHEFEFERNKNYAAGNGGRRESQNGALSLWWTAPADLSLGIQWRYARNKLGTGGDLGAIIYSLKCNL